MSWPDPDFAEQEDLCPFSPEVLVEARTAFGGGPQNKTVEFYRFLFRQYADRRTPLYHFRQEPSDPAVLVIPTRELPWSDQQLRRALPQLPAVPVLAHDDLAFEYLRANRPRINEKPKYEFQRLQRVYENDRALDLAIRSEYSHYLPWGANKLHHLLYVCLTAEEYAAETLNDNRPIREAFVRHARHNLFLREYAENLIPAKLKQQKFDAVCRLETLLWAYHTWTNADKCLTSRQLRNLWIHEVLMATYELHASSRSNVTYAQLLQQITQARELWHLCVTSNGWVLVTAQMKAMLEARGVYVEEKAHFGEPGWDVPTIQAQASFLLNRATGADDVLGQTIMPELYDVNKVVHAFLHLLYETETSFQLHVCQTWLPQAFLRTAFCASRRSKDLNCKPSATMIKNWLAQPPAEDQQRLKLWFEQNNTLFHGQSRRHIPLLATYEKYQRWVAKTWPYLKLDAVDAKPPHANCQVDGQGADRRFLKVDKAQELLIQDFGPESPGLGKAIFASVGSGKTCSAAGSALKFAQHGYQIVWVTKNTLKNQVLKNHVTEICNEKIRQKFDTHRVLAGLNAAQEWLKKIPPQQSTQSVLRFLKDMEIPWTNLSYRQLSNALAPVPRNDHGRQWQKRAAPFGFKDPLFKTFIIIDEADKMFTGELDVSERPDVAQLKRAIQHSYRTSGTFCVRLMLLTATPTNSSVLPLFNMLNLLHAHDTFEHEMVPPDPQGQNDAAHQTENEKREVAAACDLFPLQICGHENQAKKPRRDPKRERDMDEDDDDDEEDEEEEGSPEKIAAYFDTRSLVGQPTVLAQLDLSRNHVAEFWRKSFALISYYNISSDYSRFPRTEYKTIIMPSCSFFQERLMTQALTSIQWKSTKDLRQKIRQIAAWAAYPTIKTEARKPTELDQLIMQENERNSVFEASVEHLEERVQQMKQRIEEQKAARMEAGDAARLAKFSAEWEEAEAKIQTWTKEYDELVLQKGSSSAKAALTRKMNLVKHHMNNLQVLMDGLNFFESEKQRKVAYLEKKLQRVEKLLSYTRHKRNQQAESKARVDRLDFFLNKVKDVTLIDEVEELPSESKHSTRARARTKPSQASEEEREEDDDVDIRNADDQQFEREQDLSFRAHMKKEYYTVKNWRTVKANLPQAKPKYPKVHFFDQPDTFDKARFLRDMPLYSPQVTELMKVIRDEDARCKMKNTEPVESDRLRKHLIFCQDIHSIRAVAGALMAHDWTFGMQRQYVKWEKLYLAEDDNSELHRVEAKAQTLTWVPDRRAGGKSADFSRFVILTKSKLGGPAGATLNDYAIQSLTKKGSDATYNHERNARGQDFRIILIDQNFLAGIDLIPTPYLHIFDPLMDESSRTQLVGRISRLCGDTSLPFIPQYGWPQTVYRYGLKFHTNGLHFSEAQLTKLHDLLADEKSILAQLVPKPYREAFQDKLSHDVFSPLELQIWLKGDLATQRLKKQTLDVYNTLIEKVSSGALLLAPAMQNLSVARTNLAELMEEERETELEFRQEILDRDRENQARRKHGYHLRRQRQVEAAGFDFDDTPLYEFVRREVQSEYRKNVLKTQRSDWSNATFRDNFFRYHIQPGLLNAQFVNIPEAQVKKLVFALLDEKMRVLEEEQKARDREKEEKARLKAEKHRHQEEERARVAAAKLKAKHETERIKEEKRQEKKREASHANKGKMNMREMRNALKEVVKKKLNKKMPTYRDFASMSDDDIHDLWERGQREIAPLTQEQVKKWVKQWSIHRPKPPKPVVPQAVPVARDVIELD